MPGPSSVRPNSPSGAPAGGPAGGAVAAGGTESAAAEAGSILDGGLDSDRLLRTVRAADWERDPVGVVRFVERWAERGPLPPDARVAEARALLALSQVDRAWMRLKEALGEAPDHVDALVLTVEMFVRRGWPGRARVPLERLGVLAPDDPRLPELRASVARPPIKAPPQAGDIERSGDRKAILALVEHYLSTGSVLRAQSILERQGRASGARRDRQVEALLWGIRGDYTDGSDNLDDLAQRLVPQLDPEEWGTADHTESARLVDLMGGEGADGRAGPAFPSLFRGDSDEVPGERRDDDVTMASVMANREDLADPPTRESEDGEDPDEDEMDDYLDTQILDIIQPVAGAIEDPGASADPLRRPLDLKALQARTERTRDADATGDVEPLEDEDADLVVLTRREPARDPDTVQPVGGRAPIEVIEKVPVPPPLPEGLPGQDEETPEVSPAFDPPPDAEATVELDDIEPPIRRGRAAQPRLLVGAALAGLGLLGLAWAGVSYMQRVAADGIVDDVHGALAVGDRQRLESLAETLRQQVETDGGPTGVLAAELALVEAVLYDEVSGDRAGRKRAADALAVAEGAGVASGELALARGALAWADGDAAGALASFEMAPSGDQVRDHLLARAALSLGDMDRARATYPAEIDIRQMPRVASLAPGIALAADASAVTEDLVSMVSQAPAVLVPALAEGWGAGPPEARLAAVDRLIERHGDALGPRQRGRLEAARVDIIFATGDVTAAAKVARAALSLAPTSPEVRHRMGAMGLVTNRAVGALDHFSACLTLRPRDAACQRGRLQALIELDRLVEARDAVSSWASQGDDVRLWSSWVDAASGEAGAARAGVDAVMAQSGFMESSGFAGLALYIRGISAVVEGSTDAQAAADLARAAQTLSASDAPLDQLLGGRAEAARLRLEGPDASDSAVLRVLADTPTNPMVKVHIAAMYESAGLHDDAAQLLALAAESGAQSARVHYARGLLLFDPATMPAARAAWRRYLDLGPTGPRADRVRERMGR
jgi:hypothetical protein